jgi:hypothetical protein
VVKVGIAEQFDRTLGHPVDRFRRVQVTRDAVLDDFRQSADT